MFGHGTFVYQPDYTINIHGSADKAARAAKDMGMQHAWVRGHNKNGLWKAQDNLALANAFRNHGLSVGVWGWCDGNNVSHDIENAKDAIRTFDPDIYVADIEDNVSNANWDESKARRFGSEIKQFLGTTPLAVSSFGYIRWHKPEIMTALDPYADYFAPQVYWFWYPNQQMLDQTPVSGLRLRNPADYTKVCIYHWQQAVTKPLIVTGQAYWGETSGWTQARAEEKLQQFLDEFEGYADLAGFNWWSFSDGRAMSKKMTGAITAADLGSKLPGGDASPAVVARDGGGGGGALPQPATEGLFWVAAEGLNFRSAPDGDDDDNVLGSLDYDSSVLVTADAENGYVRGTTVIDGSETNGFVFKGYLRPNESAMVERAIQEAITEWLRFEKGAGLEHQDPYSGYINEMWTELGYPNLTGKDQDWFWSAAYISFILKNAGYTRTKFDIRHSTFIHESIQNRILERDRDFWGYRLDEVEPQVGDILCQWRGSNETTYDEAEVQSRFESHTDIIIAVRDRAVITLGGNVANASSNGAGVSVETKSFRRLANGLMVDERRLFAIMKNRHRPFPE